MVNFLCRFAESSNNGNRKPLLTLKRQKKTPRDSWTREDNKIKTWAVSRAPSTNPTSRRRTPAPAAPYQGGTPKAAANSRLRFAGPGSELPGPWRRTWSCTRTTRGGEMLPADVEVAWDHGSGQAWPCADWGQRIGLSRGTTRHSVARVWVGFFFFILPVWVRVGFRVQLIRIMYFIISIIITYGSNPRDHSSQTYILIILVPMHHTCAKIDMYVRTKIL
jgi:hypothetical protein